MLYTIMGIFTATMTMSEVHAKGKVANAIKAPLTEHINVAALIFLRAQKFVGQCIIIYFKFRFAIAE